MKATKKCPVCEKLVYTRKLREHLFFVGVQICLSDGRESG
jgi:hypothetical protein